MRNRGLPAFLTIAAVLAACRPDEAGPPATTPDGHPLPPVAIAAKPDTEWVHRLPDLLPAIRACAARLPDGHGFVTIAWPMNKGRLGVRLASPDGPRHECLVQDFADSVVVERYQPLADDDVNAGERNPVFLLPGWPLLEGGCWAWEQAEEADGSVLGVLGYSTC
ncbi:MAG TPA: hypothetical protein VLL51_06820 [Gemmatimonadales bacterium]|nr:hypothetical protein [Gemmatimonadales bacterium]